MINITDKSTCTGCWACANICPKGCIEMIEDSEGFNYPIVDTSKCIDCGLCNKVCPMQKSKLGEKQPDSYIVQIKDSDVLRNSTSGGFFTAISKYIIDKGGVVFGSTFDENMTLIHSYSETIEDCAKYRGSKYTQSLIKDTYKQAKEFLKQGRLVVFSGTPCQIAGLYGYLQKPYDNLITVDLVCHGVPSPLLLKKYFIHNSLKYNSKIIDYRSRDKYYGYDFSTATIWFKDREIKYHKGVESDLILRLYFKNICSRPSCYSCHYKTLERISDITIFDCWDAKATSKIFDERGATNVFIHSQKGSKVFNELKPQFLCAKSDIESIIKRDGIMIRNYVPVNTKRAEFFEDLNTKSIDFVEKKYLNTSMLKSVIIRLKPALYKIGVFKLYMIIKGR